ncbi:hypothetical protein HFN62_23675 [Rhizobium leguminosarum]|uniref:hypothetical protein n=1 Tax=Rhizobium leguminosarum TaxID=384 RepID=UPI001C97DB69|nr:hypothetical protein [Rhizobium leguminosarum]MBY5786713.1 hypothetical protein [Rhizobium leguminosarum]
MGVINLPESERNALAAIDENVLRSLIDKACDEGRQSDLNRLPLSSCGAYVGSKLYNFEQALKRYREAKSAKNRESKHYSARRAGDDLSFAVMSMKQRMATEETERETVRIDDNIMPPWTFGRKLSVRVYYRWRGPDEIDWQSGSIVFRHEVRPRYVYDPSPPKRKPSAAKQAEQLQEELGSTWEDLTLMALCSVRDFFREGGRGSDIPEEFEVVPDSHDGHLNNYSTIFWKTPSTASV